MPALLFVALSLRTLQMRRRPRIAVGDKGDEAMLRAMRAHANFAEYVPLSLLLFYFVEQHGGRPVLVHAFGTSLLIGRLLHAWAVSRPREHDRFRVAGMTFTFLPLIAASVRLLYVGRDPRVSATVYGATAAPG